ncbi:hypothetical protein LUZ60_009437 [Juncus effusus]|nr:hypothetical protein LUZ60_009437 [Juncus effusus]
MSRLCVKNLPKYVNEDRLREFFSQKGEVTDAKIMRTSDGKSRQFAFVGFRTEKEGEEALRYFNNTYMDTCKITCEVARKVGDLTIPQPWSRHSVKKEITPSKKETISPSKNKSKSKKGTEPSKSDGQDSSDPKLQEFLHVMQPRAKSKIWENDIAGISEQETETKEKKKKSVKKKKKSETSVEEITESQLEREDDRVEKKKDESVTDTDYFKSRVKKDWSDSESGSESEPESESESGSESESESKSESDGSKSDLESESELETEQKESEETKTAGSDEENPNDEKKLALDTGRLFVRNLAYTTMEDELRELFEKYGDVSQVHIVVDRDTKRSKGIGYVLFASPESALRALEELDNSIFQGRLLHIMAARPQKSDKSESDEKVLGEKNSLKKMREEKRKEVEASGDTRAWNSLFMRQDTVVENIARKNGITKSELLDREADDLAVRIALGETHIIKETKRSLSNSGVNVSALEELASKRNESHKRSNHVVLVKNLPYSCSEGDLVSMFGKYGSVERVILPPSRALALVIFLEAAEARSAFKGLAYKRYKDSPLYLEWAPDDILSANPTSVVGTEEEKDEFVGEKDAKKVLLDQSSVDEEDIDPDRVESRSLFVKNLNFRTTDESLKQYLSGSIKTGTIKSVKIKKHLKNGKNVSMGFGFVEFDSVETATNACKDLQGTVLDGHALILQLCHGKRESSAPKKEGKDFSSTKLIVRNVAFEATTKDLRQLFIPFGQIKSVRLPMKFGTHRGFAFVEYVTKQEAQNAMQSLSNTHLYGRHLVIERAKEGETLEELRERTAAQFVDERSGFKTLSRKRKQMGLVDEGNVKFSRIVE